MKTYEWFVIWQGTETVAQGTESTLRAACEAAVAALAKQEGTRNRAHIEWSEPLEGDSICCYTLSLEDDEWVLE